MVSAYAPPPRPKLELNAWGGWATSSNVSGSGATLQIGDTNSWGAAIGVRVPQGVLAELKWIYLDPEVEVVGLGTADTTRVATNYFLLSGEKGFRRGKAEPFLYGALGAVVFSPGSFSVGGTRYSPDSTWRMAFGLGGGLKVWLTDRLGVRLCAEMLAPIFFGETSFYVGTGGAGLGISGGIPTVTGNFTAGISFQP